MQGKGHNKPGDRDLARGAGFGEENTANSRQQFQLCSQRLKGRENQEMLLDLDSRSLGLSLPGISLGARERPKHL